MLQTRAMCDGGNNPIKIPAIVTGPHSVDTLGHSSGVLWTVGHEPTLSRQLLLASPTHCHSQKTSKWSPPELRPFFNENDQDRKWNLHKIILNSQARFLLLLSENIDNNNRALSTQRPHRWPSLLNTDNFHGVYNWVPFQYSWPGLASDVVTFTLSSNGLVCRLWATVLISIFVVL